MSAGQVLDTIERLFTAAGHPDIAEVTTYLGNTGPAIEVVYQSKAKAFIWPVTDDATATPTELPDELPEYKFRASYALKLLTDMLTIARPEGWRWRTVAVEGVALRPCGLEVWAGGRTTLLRVTSASTPLPADSDPADWAGWQPPASIT